MNESPPPNADPRAYRELLLNPELGELRQQFCRAVAAALTDVAGWLGIDSFVGGGDEPRLSGFEETEGQKDSGYSRYTAFWGAAVVLDIAAELASGAVLLLDSDLTYAAAALIRQLIETEYLLTAFSSDLQRASVWASATPEDIRKSFSTGKMREAGAFSNEEYWRHCDAGGHPSPHGRPLLRRRGAYTTSDTDIASAASWADLAQHLRRLWSAANSLLASHHARYPSVLAHVIDGVGAMEAQWVAADSLSDFSVPGWMDRPNT